MTIATAIVSDDSLPQGRRRLQRYSETSDSPMPFVPRLPSHWRVEKLKHVAAVRFSSVDKKTEEGEAPVRLCNYTDVYNQDKIVDDPEFMQATATAAEIARHTLKKGDVLITKDSEEWDDIAVPAYVTANMPGVLCGYHLAHIRPHPTELDGAFLSRAFAADGIRQQFHIAANGVTRYGLPNRAISGALFPIPPLNEQRAIATFLDHETTRIDELIAKKAAIVELLRQQHDTRIFMAVTKGLSDTVSFTDSGIEWLGRMPAHWKVKKVKHFTRILRGKFTHRPRNDPRMYDGPYPFIQTGDVSGAEKYIREYSQTLSEDGFAVSKQFPKGTLVMTIAANIGDMAILDFEACFPDSIVGFVPGRDISIDYLFYLFKGMRQALFSTATLNTQLNLNIERIGSLWTAAPPLNEQSDTVRWLEAEQVKTLTTTKTIVRAINRLRDYRTALISSAVTGRIDVRTYRPEATCQ
jgi:type I restriction enzyme S subunit